MTTTNSKKQRLLLLGAGFMQGVAIREAHALGCEVAAVDGNPQAVCAAEADTFEPIDLKDVPALVHYAKKLQNDGGLDGVFTAATDFSASVAAIAEACGLHGHSLEAALNATDKVRMRRCFAYAGVVSPAFAELTRDDVADAQSLSAKVQHLSFPLVVKPVDNMGARGCCTVYTESELCTAGSIALDYSRSGRIIAEECISGQEFSIEGLIFDGQLYITALADRHIFFPPYFIEMGHTIPSCCSDSLASEIMAVFEQGVRSLGLHEGAVKGDILVKNGKAFVGEIAARLSGGYMSGWTVPYSSGLNITRAAIQLALGKRPVLQYADKTAFAVPLEHISPRFSAERAWISIPGKVAALLGIEQAQKSAGVLDVFPRTGVGDTAVFPQNNVEKCGNVIAVAGTYEEAAACAETACRHIVVRLMPCNAATEAFLSALNPLAAKQQEFPPNFVQFSSFPYQTFTDAFEKSPYIQEDMFFLPAFIAENLDSASDLQGRSLRMLLQQSLAQEPHLTALLTRTAGDSASEHFFDGVEKSRYWAALIRGGIQGLLYCYDCTHA